MQKAACPPSAEGDHSEGVLTQARTQSKKTWDKTSAYMTRERDRLEKEIQETRDKVETKISELRNRQEKTDSKHDQQGGTEKTETDRQLVNWEEQRQNLAHFQQKTESASRSTWNGIKKQWGKLRDEVQKQLDGKDSKPNP